MRVLTFAVHFGCVSLLALVLASPALAVSTSRGLSTMLPESAYSGETGSRSAFSANVSAEAAAGAACTAAPQPGSGGWYWPVGTEDFRGWSGWLAPRGSYVHVAQDMPTSYLHPVYAIGDGTVFISRADAGGYGVGGSPGGCMIITHTTAAGQRFHALYGHVSGLRFTAGQRVRAGQVIAKVNGCRHLHFSIHPSATYRDRNPYAGHVPKSWADHGGFVDPVEYLKKHPRAASYLPPALPRQKIVTAVPPRDYGAVDGAAFWTEEGEAGTVRYRYDLATRERAALAPDDVVPTFDSIRYDVLPLVAPARGLAVSDRLPALALKAEHATPPWGKPAQISATLTNSAGAPLRGALVRLEQRRGAVWSEVQLGVTDAGGSAAFSYGPARRTILRATFAPPVKQPEQAVYLGATSRSVALTPRVAVTTPRVRRTVASGTPATIAGFLTPRHPAGKTSVQLVLQRLGASRWVTRLTIGAPNRDAGSRSRYVRSPRLRAAGRCRVRAVHPADGFYAQSFSAWRSFSVR